MWICLNRKRNKPLSVVLLIIWRQQSNERIERQIAGLWIDRGYRPCYSAIDNVQPGRNIDFDLVFAGIKINPRTIERLIVRNDEALVIKFYFLEPNGSRVEFRRQYIRLQILCAGRRPREIFKLPDNAAAFAPEQMHQPKTARPYFFVRVL